MVIASAEQLQYEFNFTFVSFKMAAHTTLQKRCSSLTHNSQTCSMVIANDHQSTLLLRQEQQESGLCKLTFFQSNTYC